MSEVIGINKQHHNINFFWKSWYFSIVNLFKNWIFWLMFGLCLIAFLFLCIGFPLIVRVGIANYYSNPDWLTVSYPASAVVIVIFSSIVGELNANKYENIYSLTKNVSRSSFVSSKFVSTITIGIFFALLVEIFFVITNHYIYKSSRTHSSLFTLDVTWYGLLSTFLICALFGATSTLTTYQIRSGFSTLALVVLITFFMYFYPMVWYVNDANNTRQNINRLWYLFYGPISFYLPLTIIILTIFFTIFIKQRMNI